jgi:hypothetical protein
MWYRSWPQVAIAEHQPLSTPSTCLRGIDLREVETQSTQRPSDGDASGIAGDDAQSSRNLLVREPLFDAQRDEVSIAIG